jgi:hypothetical protein
MPVPVCSWVQQYGCGTQVKKCTVR